MRKGFVEIVSIMDQSGSMNNIKNDAIGGRNSFVQEQQNLEGFDASFTEVFFSTEVKVVSENVPIKEVQPLTTATYRPGGGTALLDAIGISIDRVGKRLANTPEEQRPEQVIFVIMTDGEENSSFKFNNSQIREMVQHQTDVYKWNFNFLAANIDAFAAGASLGISAGQTQSYEATPLGTRKAMRSASSSVLNLRQSSQSVVPSADSDLVNQP